LNERAYKDNPRTLNDLKKAISQAMNGINPTVLRRVSWNMSSRVELCQQEDGGHLQHLL